MLYCFGSHISCAWSRHIETVCGVLLSVYLMTMISPPPPPQIQIVLLFILLLAIGDFVIGTFIPVEAKESIVANIDLQGYTFYSGRQLHIIRICMYIVCSRCVSM